jgi:hypothetical protein
MLNGEFLSYADIVPLITPVDFQTGANAGDWVNMAGYEHAVIVLYKGIGTAGQDPIFKLQQATSSAGANAKDLLFTRIRSKVGVTGGSFLLSAVPTWTLNTQAAATSYTDAVSAEAEAMIAVEIKTEDLDVNGGFTWVQLSVADVGGNAQLACAFAIMINGRYIANTMPTSIV